MNEETRRAIMAEIAAAYQRRKKEPWQFDTLDYLEQQPGMSRGQVYDMLMRLVRAGKLETQMVVDRGRNRRVFWRNQDVPETRV